MLYCRSGRMSEIAAAELVPLGYTNVWNPAGGMKIPEVTAAAISTFNEDPYYFCCALCKTLFDRAHQPQH